MLADERMYIEPRITEKEGTTYELWQNELQLICDPLRIDNGLSLGKQSMSTSAFAFFQFVRGWLLDPSSQSPLSNQYSSTT